MEPDKNEQDELETFRKKWLKELETTNSKLDSILTNKTKCESSNDSKSVCEEELMTNIPPLQIPKTEFSETSRKSIESYFVESPGSSRKCLKRRKSGSSSDASGKYAAFDIANNYLNATTDDCTYCISEHSSCGESSNKRHETKSPIYKKSDGKLCFKRHYDFSEFNDVRSCEVKKQENLVDALIADIDEITCIPFFDIELPLELAVKIFHFLPIDDLMNCCKVNTKWKRLAQDDLIWFNLCDAFDVLKSVQCVADRHNWYQYVKDAILERRRIQKKWKERCCEVRDLGKEEDLVLCTASIYHDHIATSYLDGCVRLWDLKSGLCGENLKEKHANIEEVVLSICSSIHLNEYLCIACFENGDVMVWRRDDQLHGHLVFVDNFSQCVFTVLGGADGKHFLVSLGSRFILVGESLDDENSLVWSRKFEHNMTETIVSLLLANTTVSSTTVIFSTNHTLNLNVNMDVDDVLLDQLTGATFSMIDYKKSFVVAGISGFGYSVLDGYRALDLLINDWVRQNEIQPIFLGNTLGNSDSKKIRKYCLQTGKHVANIIGSQTGIICLNYADCRDDQVVVACADCSIRIHDFKSESLLVSISGIESSITCVQADKWKIVCGYQNGMVCLWDLVSGAKCWQSQSSKHPVRIAHFDDQLLTSVTIPEDKFKERIYYFEENPSNQKQQQGCVRVMDFTKDNITVGVPDACRAEYDDIAGYDYNIELIAPYDDVQSLRLPQM